MIVPSSCHPFEITSKDNEGFKYHFETELAPAIALFYPRTAHIGGRTQTASAC